MTISKEKPLYVFKQQDVQTLQKTKLFNLIFYIGYNFATNFRLRYVSTKWCNNMAKPLRMNLSLNVHL